MVTLAGATPPRSLVNVTVAPDTATPPLVTVTVTLLVLTPSAGIEDGDAVSDTTTPWNITVVVAVKLETYPAVSVAVEVDPLAGAVSVVVACPLPSVVSDVAARVPPLVESVTVRPEYAAPPRVSAIVTVLVDWPSAPMEAGEADTDSATPSSVTVADAVAPDATEAVTVAVELLPEAGDVRSAYASPLAFVTAVVLDTPPNVPAFVVNVTV